MISFPAFLAVGRITPATVASMIYSYYVSVARGADDLNEASDVDVATLARLAFGSARLYVRETTDPPSDLVIAVEAEFRRQGMVWATRAAMVSDLQALRDACNVFFQYVRDSVPEARTFAARTYDATGTESEQSPTIAKSEALGTQIGQLRAAFA